MILIIMKKINIFEYKIIKKLLKNSIIYFYFYLILCYFTFKWGFK